MNTQNLTTVNNIQLQVIENENEILIPIKPICEAIGVDSEGQRQRILRDEILSSVAFMVKATGTDKKQYEMMCIPLEFIFGWIFSIDTSKVNENAKEGIIEYKKQCYQTLYNHFFANMRKQIESNKIEVQILKELNEFSEHKNKLRINIKEKKTQLEQLRKERLNNQLQLF